MNGINKTKYLTILTLFFFSLLLTGCGGGGGGGATLTDDNNNSNDSLHDSDGTPYDTSPFWFDPSVALSKDGKTLAIGIPAYAYNYDYPEDNINVFSAGTVYVYTYTKDGWIKQAQILRNEYNKGLFGFSVALSADGNTLAVGSVDESFKDQSNPEDDYREKDLFVGAAYIFTRTSGSWSERQRLQPSNINFPIEYSTATEYLDLGAQFGYSLALSDDGKTLVVGAQQDLCRNPDTDKLEMMGAVYTFTNTDDYSWEQQQKVVPSDCTVPETSIFFGRSVTLSANGKTLAVGAPLEITDDPHDFKKYWWGAAYVFTRGSLDDDWSQRAHIIALPDYNNQDTLYNKDFFGESMALSADGNTLAVGAPSGGTSGNVYIFTNNAFWLNEIPTISLISPISSIPSLVSLIYPKYNLRSPDADTDKNLSKGFGQSIALSADGKTLAVSMPDKNEDTDDHDGAMYIFADENTDNLVLQKSFIADTSREIFGSIVALSGDGKSLVNTESKLTIKLGKPVDPIIIQLFKYTDDWPSTPDKTIIKSNTDDKLLMIN